MSALLIYRGALGVHCTYVHFRQMQVIRIGVGFATQHFAYYQPFQTTADGLSFLYCPYLQTDGGQDLRYRLCIILQVDVAFQPLVRNIHFSIYVFIYFL